MAIAKTFALLALLFSSLAVGEGIYKWIDEEGCVHFGDAPPDFESAEEISVDAFPVSETPTADQRTNEIDVKEPIGRVDAKEPARESSQQETDDAKQFGFISATCLDSFASLLDLEKEAEADAPGIFEPLSPRQLERDEFTQLGNFLPKLDRRWSGTINEILCMGPDRSIREKKHTWRVTAVGSWSSSGVLDFRFDRTRDDGVRRQDQISISIQNNQLRFRSGRGPMVTSSPSFRRNPPKQCDDVEILSIDRNGMAFFNKYRRRFGPRQGSVQVQDVYSFRVMDRAFQIDQVSYVQGRLVEKSTWSLRR